MLCCALWRWARWAWGLAGSTSTFLYGGLYAVAHYGENYSKLVTCALPLLACFFYLLSKSLRRAHQIVLLLASRDRVGTCGSAR